MRVRASVCSPTNHFVCPLQLSMCKQRKERGEIEINQFDGNTRFPQRHNKDTCSFWAQAFTPIAFRIMHTIYILDLRHLPRDVCSFFTSKIRKPQNRRRQLGESLANLPRVDWDAMEKDGHAFRALTTV